MWGQILGAAIGAVSSAFGARRANKEARSAARTQMDFQERMSNTQYQRGMTDMKLAGLNPILAYKQGGAGTPGGSSYSPVNVGAAATSGASAGASSAMAHKRFKLEEAITAETIGKLAAEKWKNYSSASVDNQNRIVLQLQEKLQRQQMLTNQPSVNSARTAAKFYNTPAGKRAVVLDLIGRSINPFSKALKGQ